MEQSVRALYDGSGRSGQSLSGLQRDKETRRSGSSRSLSTLEKGRMQQLTPSADTVSRIHLGNQHTTRCIDPYSAKSQESVEKMKKHAFFSENTYVESRHLQDVSGSASGIILYQSGSGKKILEFERSSISSYMGGHFVPANDQLPNSDIKQSETQHYRCNTQSVNLLGTTLIKSHTTSVKSSTQRSQLDPSISVDRSSVSRDNHLQLENFPAFKQKQLSSHGNYAELSKLEKFHHGYSSMRKLPPLVPKVETLRICASLDSVAGLSGWFPRLSQSTHVKFGKENGIKNVRVASNSDVNAYLTSTSPFLLHGQQGVKIRYLGSSADREWKKTHEDSEGNLKDASSADTDVMDMDSFTEKFHTSGVKQSSPTKALNTSTMQLSRDRSGTKVSNSHINKELQDINLELSAENNAIEDPTERWAKRLKSCASDTKGVGTQSFDLEDVTRKKIKRPSDLLTSELRGYNHMEILAVADKTNAIQRNNVTSSKDATKRSKDLLLSQSWIQRWLRNQASTPEKQSKALVQYEPQSSKLVLDDPEKKQFPSIAAMALMGKAMNGFQPCELQNRGPFVVWN